MKTFLSSILAGFFIGLGGTVFLRLQNSFPGSNVVGAIFFTIGLLTILTSGLVLFTGRACLLYKAPTSYWVELITVWIGNFVGVAVICAFERLTSIYSGLQENALALVERKMTDSCLSLFFLGLLCNVCISIAVFAYMSMKEKGIVLVFLAVVVFILCGMEHSVADMYYWFISGVFTAEPIESLGRLFAISLGNLTGGLITQFCMHHALR